MKSSVHRRPEPIGFKDALAAGKSRVGVICNYGSPQLVELYGWLGYDWVFIDMEHGDGLDVGNVVPLIRAADVGGLDVIVRVPRFDAGMIQSLLDCGADGICVPHVQTREDAVLAVRATKYPPEGDRSMNPYVRAAAYGTAETWDEYWPRANQETIVMVIVEEAAGMENLDAIAAVPGIDVLWIGTGDLGQSLGVAPGSSELREARKRGAEVAKQHGLAFFGVPLTASTTVDRETRQAQVRETYDEGSRVFAVIDTAVYAAALTEILESVRVTVDEA